MSSDALKNSVLALRQQADTRFGQLQRRVGARDALLMKKQEVFQQTKHKQNTANVASKALYFVERAVRNVRKEVLGDVERVVNEALRSVYVENSPRLECEVSTKRDRSSVVPYFIKHLPNGEVVRRPPASHGCGVSDITSLVLRMVLLRAKGAEPVLVADEPFRFLGARQVPRASALLSQVSHNLGIQTIVTTHHDETVELSDVAHYLTLNDTGAVKALREEQNHERRTEKKSSS